MNRDLHTVKRLADWMTRVENEGEWFSRSTKHSYGRGPVVELELGYRAASYFLNAPSCGSWVR